MRRGVIRAEIQRIADHRVAIIQSLGIRGLLAKRALTDIADHAVTYHALDLSDEPPRRGRPPRERLGILVNLLALTWERYHDRWPGRSYSAYERTRVGRSGRVVKGDDGPFVRFARTCISAIDPDAKYPPELVKRVIRGRKVHSK